VTGKSIPLQYLAAVTAFYGPSTPAVAYPSFTGFL
jgi:hypothetical protein